MQRFASLNKGFAARNASIVPRERDHGGQNASEQRRGNVPKKAVARMNQSLAERAAKPPTRNLRPTKQVHVKTIRNNPVPNYVKLPYSILFRFICFHFFRKPAFFHPFLLMK
jgi:hypothetical protein